MALKINEEDRIKNRRPPKDPNDKTEINADNVMLIFDRLVDGGYRLKIPFWSSYDDFLNNAEEREIAIVEINGRLNLVIKLNNEVIILGG